MEFNGYNPLIQDYIFLISALLVLTTAGAVLSPTADAPLIAGSTAKSSDQFESCFVAIQQRQSRPSWFLPNELGGRISNEGTDGVDNPYQVRFTQSGVRNRIEAFIARRGGPEEGAIVDAIQRCW